MNNNNIDAWLTGQTDIWPQDLKLAVKDLVTKLQFSQGSLMINQLKRSMKLMQTINMLEAQLTDPKYLLTLDPDAQFIILKYCNESLMKNLDSINKFMMANQDLKSYTDPKTQSLQNLLMSLTSEEIDQILLLLENSTNND